MAQPDDELEQQPPEEAPRPEPEADLGELLGAMDSLTQAAEPAIPAADLSQPPAAGLPEIAIPEPIVEDQQPSSPIEAANDLAEQSRLMDSLSAIAATANPKMPAVRRERILQADAKAAQAEFLAREAVQPKQGEAPADYLQRMEKLTKAADPLQREAARMAINRFDAAAEGNLDGGPNPFPVTDRLDADANKAAGVRAALARVLETNAKVAEAFEEMLLDHDRKLNDILRHLEEYRS